MPKGRKKDSKKATRGSREPSDDEFGVQDTPDNVSIISSGSSALEDGNAPGDNEVDETSAQEQFEEKLKDCIDGTSQKSSKGRINCLQGMCQAFSKKYIDEFIIDRKVTITDAIDRCLKKGGSDEQTAAATCAMLVMLQLGGNSDGEECLSMLKPTMQTVMLNNAMPLKARSACATALGLGHFVACTDILEVQDLMKTFEGIFRLSYLKGDGSVPLHTPEVTTFHASALSSWTLLLSVCPSSSIRLLVDSHLGKMCELLRSNQVDLRIEAGEAIAMLYELAREIDEDYDSDDIAQICATLKDLATDSNKFRAKKDRKTQRSSFRDILKTVEEGQLPELSRKFGTETLEIYSWTQRKQYDSLSTILGSGMNTHLERNMLLREIFQLGPPILEPSTNTSSGKHNRHVYAAAFKARTKCRSKARDKRNATLHE